MLQPLSLKVAKLHPNHELGLKLRQTRFCGYEKSFPGGPRGRKLRLLGVTDENGPICLAELSVDFDYIYIYIYIAL